MTAPKVAAYGQGVLYPPGLGKNTAGIADAGWTHLMLSLFHIDADGDLFYNDLAIVVSGKYVADYQWISGLQKIVQPEQGQGVTLLATFGGWGVGDFGNVKNIYEHNNNSFDGTNLKNNFTLLYSKLGSLISIIDMDVEKDYDQTSFVAFCEMLIDIGFKITFCPYTNQEFWTGSLRDLNSSKPGSVLWWNLQCYSGGTGNQPQEWAQAISDSIDGFDTAGFILVSDSAGADDPPSSVQTMLEAFKAEASVGGAFLWTIDGILDDTTGQLTVRYPLTDYVQAIETALD